LCLATSCLATSCLGTSCLGTSCIFSLPPSGKGIADTDFDLEIPGLCSD
jgi:hypothetical protein